MGDVGIALVVAFVMVSVVMLGVGAIAYFGQRAVSRPASPRALRRMAYASAAFGFFGLGGAVVGVVAGTPIAWIVIIQCLVLLLMATGWLRDPRVSAARESWDEQAEGL